MRRGGWPKPAWWSKRGRLRGCKRAFAAGRRRSGARGGAREAGRSGSQRVFARRRGPADAVAAAGLRCIASVCFNSRYPRCSVSSRTADGTNSATGPRPAPSRRLDRARRRLVCPESKRSPVMKLLRYGPVGHEKPGLLDAAGCIRDLSSLIDDVAGDALSDASLARLAAVDPASLPLVAGEPRIGACVGRIGKFVCIGLNYADHAAEAGLAVPTEPVVFGKWTSAVSGPHDGIEIPRGSVKTDWEVELGVVIGRACKNVDEADALSHVAGYCVVNDVSEREWQIERGGQWDKGKGFDTFGPIGPWLVTRDEIADPQALDLWLDVDGRRYQSGNTRTMVFTVAQLIAYLSRCMSLQPGDVISTGTPPGVGMGVKPLPVYLKPGQTVRCGVAGLGEQRQTTRAAA
ncbi:fumarylacetoacetate hydrolase family protein [Burkholderia thailandensis E264]|uniref:Fumarylacetoacetate hydrolase family protein n=3 Tax=Burkholderia thailandensis TaxID=57975 RepID=Q2T361_BURTA|nr:fumarylacetoacetate hydrolase family protein [Burkholderia thailandensis E264]